MAGLCAQHYGCSVLIFSVADIDAKERVDDSLVGFGTSSLVKISKQKFGQDFEVKF